MARTKNTKNTDAKQLANDAIKSEQFYTLNYYEFEEIVCAYYKRDNYSLILSMESDNDVNYVFEAKREELEDWDVEELQNFLHKKQQLFSEFTQHLMVYFSQQYLFCILVHLLRRRFFQQRLCSVFLLFTDTQPSVT